MDQFIWTNLACLGIMLILSVGCLILLVVARRSSESKQRLLALQRQHESLKFLDEMLERYPGRPSIFWEKAKVYEALGHYDEALQNYQIAHNKSPYVYSSGDYLHVAQRLRKNTKTLEIINV